MSSSDDGSVDSVSTDAMDWPADAVFQVDKILAEKEEGGQTVYLVKWEGWSHRYNTWEPVEQFQNDLPLNIWKDQKRQIELGYEQRFDVKKWERDKIQRREKREQKRAQQRRHLGKSKKGKKPPTKAPRTSRQDSTESDFRISDEGTSESSDDDESADDDEPTQRLKSKSSLVKQKQRAFSSTSEDTDEEDEMPLIATSASRHVQTDNYRKSTKDASAGPKKVQKSNAPQKKPTNPLAKPVPKDPNAQPKHPRPEISQKKKLSPDKELAENQETATTTKGRSEKAITTSAKILKSSAVNSSSTVKSNIFANWGKEKGAKKAKEAEKDKIYKTFSAQRRAELKGRAEPPPLNSSGLPLIELGQNVVEATEKSKAPIVSASNKIATDKRHELQITEPASLASPTKPQAEQELGKGVEDHSEDVDMTHVFADDHREDQINKQQTIQSQKETSKGRELLSTELKKMNNSFETSFGAPAKTTRTENSDRGISTNEFQRQAMPIPFRQLQRSLSGAQSFGSARENQSVYGHIVIERELISIEMECNSKLIKYFILEIKKQFDVYFHLDYAVTVEEYRDLFEQPGNFYFGAGQIEGRYDRPRQVSIETSANQVQRFADALGYRRSAALFFTKAYSLLIWPCGFEAWGHLDAIFPSDIPKPPLRFLIRTPTEGPRKQTLQSKPMPGVLDDLSSPLRGWTRLQTALLGFSLDEVEIYKHVKHLFILYPPEQRQEHDILFMFARKEKHLQVWTSLTQGDWSEFCLRIAGKSKDRNPKQKREKGVILVHESFQDFRHLPRLFRILDKGGRLFTVDTSRKGEQPTVQTGEIPTYFELARQKRSGTTCATLGVDTDLENGSIVWKFQLPPRMVLAEIFPVSRGQAILLLDSFFVNDTHGVCRLLKWYLSNAQRQPFSLWRFVVRPHVYSWIQAVIHDLKSRGLAESEAVTWIELRRLLSQVVPQESFDSGFDFEIPNPASYPKFISFPPYTCPKLDLKYPLGDSKGKTEIGRTNDEVLFEWFARWTSGELRIFRSFLVVSGESDETYYEKMHSLWNSEWRYISFSRASQYLDAYSIS